MNINRKWFLNNIFWFVCVLVGAVSVFCVLCVMSDDGDEGWVFDDD